MRHLHLAQVQVLLRPYRARNDGAGYVRLSGGIKIALDATFARLVLTVALPDRALRHLSKGFCYRIMKSNEARRDLF
jgi:hypothetical protein